MSQPAISAHHLRKIYQVRQKSSGLRGLLRPKYSEVHAVNGIDFTIQPGEFVGFIGPNGAGKSTTIKMLTGILSRSGGTVKVGGKDPETHRQQLAYQIGTVFGQRSQLWYHLPPGDTFEVLARIYELDRAQYQQRLKKLVDAFELQEFLHIPIRKLSLGQRMRCEIAASLLHGPQLIFLDEPTIGLDVIAKQKIREVLRELNQDDGITILLTSHDAGDIEELCKRTIVINHGSMIFDDTTAQFKRKFITKKTVELLTAVPLGNLHPPLGTIVEQADRKLVIEVATDGKDSGGLQKLLAWATKELQIADMTVTDPPMEEIIASIYRAQEVPHE
ncbi:MAG TPA: ATP-binding cassette domain-containing protein [Candidatus Saccharimonadales bacterium]|nr:ATP-binding cassette domain-containing protein [Candidatus Saccharimonadales bacterium]